MRTHTKITLFSTLLAFGAWLIATAEDAPDHKDDHHHDHDHHHHGIVAGPNGGRVFTEVSPELEFFVTKDRTIQISQLDDDHKPVAIGSQKVAAIAGDRTNPTIIGFTRKDDVLVSNNSLPEGNDFPIVVTVTAEDGARTRVKFNLNLAECPTCDNLEYACECDHDHDHDHEADDHD